MLLFCVNICTPTSRVWWCWKFVFPQTGVHLIENLREWFSVCSHRTLEFSIIIEPTLRPYTDFLGYVEHEGIRCLHVFKVASAVPLLDIESTRSQVNNGQWQWPFRDMFKLEFGIWLKLWLLLEVVEFRHLFRPCLHIEYIFNKIILTLRCVGE